MVLVHSSDHFSPGLTEVALFAVSANDFASRQDDYILVLPKKVQCVVFHIREKVECSCTEHVGDYD